MLWIIGKQKVIYLEILYQKYDIEKFNNTYNNIQDSLAKIGDTNDVNIGELRTELKTLFENLTNIVFAQSN